MEHCVKDWPKHKQTCRPAAGSSSRSSGFASSAGSNRPSPFGEIPNGVLLPVDASPAKKGEWLVDCYRMRVHDEMQWAGRGRGMFILNADEEDVIDDFLVFCKLAVQSGVIKRDWHWNETFKAARCLLATMFTKADAQEKYGSEHIMDPMMGKPSLRYTGERIYGTSVQDSMDSPQYARMEHLINSGQGGFREFLEDVGGKAAWDALIRDFKISSDAVISG